MCIFTSYLKILFICIKEGNMFKIEKKEYVNRTFRLPKDLVDTLSEIAQQQDISVNELVVQCCNYAINDMEDFPRDNK